MIELRRHINFDGDQNVAAIDCLATSGSVGIATGYGLEGPGIESRWGAKFYSQVQPDPGAHPDGYWVSFRDVALTTYNFVVPRLKKV